MSNKFIFIKRAVPFVHDQINSEAMQEQLSMTTKSIGSYYVSKNSPKIGTGLTIEEERLLLPLQLSISPADINFMKEVNKWYGDFTTRVPGGQGLQLNIGLQKDNTLAISQDNLPIELMDYLRYRHALGYPNTAPSPEAAKGNSLIEFYIEDPEKVLKFREADNEIKDKAIADYMTIKGDSDRVNMVLTVMKSYIRKKAGSPPININNLAASEKVILLRDLANMRPEKFSLTVNDPNIKIIYMVEEFLSLGILQRIGAMIVDTTDSQRALGATVLEVVALLKDPKEGHTKNRLKGEYDTRKRTKVLV